MQKILLFKEENVGTTNELTNAGKKELGHPRSIKAKINGIPLGDPERSS